jgi:hypothetical protein
MPNDQEVADSALAALLFGEPPYDRATAPELELLAELAPVLPVDLVRRIAFLVSVLPPEKRDTISSAFGPRLAELDDQTFIQVIRAGGDLPPASQQRLIRVLSQADDFEKAFLLRDLAPRLSEELVSQTAAIAQVIRDEDARGFAISSLAPRVARVVGPRMALRNVESLEQPGSRAQGLALLAPFFEGEAFSVVADAEEQARHETDDWRRNKALAAVAHAYASTGRGADALRAIGSIPADFFRGEALIQVAPSLSPDLGEAALELASHLEDDERRARALMALASVVPIPAREPTLSRAFAAAQSAMSDQARARVLADLVPMLGEPLASQALEELDISIRGAGFRERRFAAIVRGLAASRQDLDEESARAAAALGPAARDLVARAASDRAHEVLENLVHQFELEFIEIGNGVIPEEPIYEVPEASPFGLRAPDAPVRYVSTGFATPEAPDEPLVMTTPLATGGSYLFWIEIGEPVPESTELGPPLPVEHLPEGARLTVVLFAFPGELLLDQAETAAEFALASDGTVRVAAPAASPQASGLLDHRLFFRIKAPEQEGVARLRCSIYHRGLLLQSRVIRARIMREPVYFYRALRSVTDYTLSRSLNPAHIGQLADHHVSLMMNENGDGTHAFRLFADDGTTSLSRDFSIEPGEISDQIRMSRSALRRISWESEDEWSKSARYRYRGEPDLDRLESDLILLATNGYRLFRKLAEESAKAGKTHPYEEEDLLRGLMRSPINIQIALRLSPGHRLPAALVYDLRFDTSIGTPSVCTAFLESLAADTPLDDTDCFNGRCPQFHEPNPGVVCPGGFWGYRHYLGMPVTMETAGDVPPTLTYDGDAQVAAAALRDLSLVTPHIGQLRAMIGTSAFAYADTREGAITTLCTSQPQIVYFYCHAGVERRYPYIRVGSNSDPGITPDNLGLARVQWRQSRPLVFINGCETADLDPERAIDFVRFFVGTAWASGVIGTEVTVFEEVARPFGEAFVDRFVSRHESVGQAIRGARLDVLKMWNPLGLIYIPFALASLRVAPRTA